MKIKNKQVKSSFLILKEKYLYFTYKQSNLVPAATNLFSAVQNALSVAHPSRFLRMATMNAPTELVAGTLNVLNTFLITHELQPALAGDTALEGFVPRPTRGAGSWRRDRICG